MKTKIGQSTRSGLRVCAAAALCTLTGAAAASAPDVSGVTMMQDRPSRVVTISYTLADGPAIVTVDVRTNGVSIGGANLWHFTGDVNRLVESGARTMTWRPDRAWPGHKIGSGVTAVVTAWAPDTPPDVMVVPLDGAGGPVEYYADLAAVPGGVTNAVYKTAKMAFRKIPAANVSWRMGSPAWETGRTAAREKPHVVTLTNDYYLGVFPVTQEQYAIVTGGSHPSEFTVDRSTRPVEKVSWNDLRGAAAAGYDWPADGHAVLSTSFIGSLRTLTGMEFDLPTEAEWEFACRAGTGTALYNGQELTDGTASTNTLNSLARYRYGGSYLDMGATAPDPTTPAAVGGTAEVGSYAPNAWGLYDMLGNVWEWCLDWYQESPLGYDPMVGPLSGSGRVIRGGGWNGAADKCRSAYRTSWPSATGNYVGVRLALPLPAAQ